jgi:hypothetical protein
MQKPRRFKTLKDRLALYAKEVREKAASLPPGAERDVLLRKARQANDASAANDWANTQGQRTSSLPKRDNQSSAEDRRAPGRSPTPDDSETT